MWKILVLGLLTLYVQLAISDIDPNLCLRLVGVPYTVTERVSLDSYVKGEMRTIEKLKFELHVVCCKGYERSPDKADEHCQPVSTTEHQDESTSTETISTVIDDAPVVPMAISNSSKMQCNFIELTLIFIWTIVHF